MKVLFWFRKSEAKTQLNVKDPKGSIQLRITIDQLEVEVGTTSIMCKKSEWNPADQSLNSKCKNRAQLNLKLSQIATTVSHIQGILSTRYDYVTPRLIKEYYLGNRKFVYSLQDINAAYFEFRNSEVSAGLITPATYSVNENYMRHILDFCKLNHLERPVHIQSTFFTDLFNFIIGTGRGRERFARKLVAFSKQVLKWAKQKRMSPSLPCFAEKMPGKAESEDFLDTTHLTVDQIMALYNFDFHKNEITALLSESTREMLSRERYAFIFNCFTGMHHCDYTKKAFTVEPYRGELFLRGRRQKTDVRFSIKLLEPAVEILKMFNNRLEDLPTKSNQKRNDTLKLVAAYAGIPVKLTTKVARKTFCDLALNEMLMSADDVAACLGLKSTKHLKNYGRIREKRLIQVMKSWNELIPATSVSELVA